MVTIDEANNVCTCRYEDGDVGEGLGPDEVFYAPGRPTEWGKGDLRGNDKMPEGALPVMFIGADEEEEGGEVNEGGSVSGERVAVIDSGSGFLKAGWAGNDSPSVVFPTILGRAEDGSITVGDEALASRFDDGLKLTNPVGHGFVTSWDDMEKIWHHTFYSKLGMDKGHLAECSVHLTEMPLNPKRNRERATQIMFDIVNVKAMYLSTTAVLALFASGRTTGAVLDCGDDVSYAVAVYEGYALPHSVQRNDVCGRVLDEVMLKISSERGYSFAAAAADAETDLATRSVAQAQYTIRGIKERVCDVAVDFSQEMNQVSEEISYELPDGKVIAFGNERFRCPEVLFQPTEGQTFEMKGIHMTLYLAINSADADMHRDLFANIVVCGGSTMFKSFGSRLKKELIPYAPPDTKIKVVAPPQRRYSSWIGGSLVSSLTAFQGMWVTRAEYDDAGPSIVHRKCF